MFASVGCAYALWFFFGLFGGHRFYVGRPISGLVWLFTCGLFGIGWVVDFFLIPEFVEEHNKRVFHQQMVETGSTLLFDGEYGGGGRGGAGGARAPYSPGGYAPQQPYAQQAYYPQPATGAGRGGYSSYDSQYY